MLFKYIGRIYLFYTFIVLDYVFFIFVSHSNLIALEERKNCFYSRSQQSKSCKFQYGQILFSICVLCCCLSQISPAAWVICPSISHQRN